MTFLSHKNAVEQAKAPGASLSTLGSSTRELLKASHKDAAAKAVADALSECPRLRFLFTASGAGGHVMPRNMRAFDLCCREETADGRAVDVFRTDDG